MADTSGLSAKCGLCIFKKCKVEVRGFKAVAESVLNGSYIVRSSVDGRSCDDLVLLT